MLATTSSGMRAGVFEDVHYHKQGYVVKKSYSVRAPDIEEDDDTVGWRYNQRFYCY